MGDSFQHDEIAWNQDQIRTEPGQNFGNEDAVFAHQGRQKQDTTGTHDELRNAGDHGQHRIAHALNRRAGDVENVEGRQADAHDGKIGHAYF